MTAEPKTLPRQLNPALDTEMPATRVVIAFGGAKRMSEITGFNLTTIIAWQRTGLIPAKWRYNEETEQKESYQRYLQRIARANKIDLPDGIFLEDVAE
jgi:hypothetical protein